MTTMTERMLRQALPPSAAEIGRDVIAALSPADKRLLICSLAADLGAEEAARAAEPDTSDIPEAGEEFFAKARLSLPADAKAEAYETYRLGDKVFCSDGSVVVLDGLTPVLRMPAPAADIFKRIEIKRQSDPNYDPNFVCYLPASPDAYREAERLRQIFEPKKPDLESLWRAIVDHTKGDLFWIGEILLYELAKETGYRGPGRYSIDQSRPVLRLVATDG